MTDARLIERYLPTAVHALQGRAADAMIVAMEAD